VGARPEEIRSEIEETRDRITAEIDELADRYSPGRIAGRTTTGAREAAASMRARVGSGATGMKQRLSLRSSSHHEHSETCGHLGEGRTGTGQAFDVGARQPVAERRGAAQRRARGAPMRRRRHPEMAEPARMGAEPDPYERRADAERRWAPSTYQPGQSMQTSGSGAMASGADLMETRPQSTHRDSARPDQPVGSAGRLSSHKGDAGLAGASLVAAALGIRKLVHQGRGERDLLAMAERRYPYHHASPSEPRTARTRKAPAATAPSDSASSGGLMTGLTAAATWAASRSPFTRHQKEASSTD